MKPAWCRQQLGVPELTDAECELFVAAALVLLPAALAADLRALRATPELTKALADLWLETGRAPAAPRPMPLHSLDETVLETRQPALQENE